MASDRSRPAFALRAALLCLPLGLPLLAGCSPPQQPPNGWVTLPNDAVVGAGDPVRAAMINTAFVFGNPGSVAGQPAEAARAVAKYAFLTVELPYGPRWRGFNPTVGIELGFGMREVEAAFGIAPNVPTQAVVDGLYGAARRCAPATPRRRNASSRRRSSPWAARRRCSGCRPCRCCRARRPGPTWRCRRWTGRTGSARRAAMTAAVAAAAGPEVWWVPGRESARPAAPAGDHQITAAWVPEVDVVPLRLVVPRAASASGPAPCRDRLYSAVAPLSRTTRAQS